MSDQEKIDSASPTGKEEVRADLAADAQGTRNAPNHREPCHEGKPAPAPEKLNPRRPPAQVGAFESDEETERTTESE